MHFPFLFAHYLRLRSAEISTLSANPAAFRPIMRPISPEKPAAYHLGGAEAVWVGGRDALYGVFQEGHRLHQADLHAGPSASHVREAWSQLPEMVANIGALKANLSENFGPREQPHSLV